MSIIGIIINTIGTVLSLFGILTKDGKYVGTWEEPMQNRKNFYKEKTIVIIGMVLIIIGNFLQIFSIFNK